MDHSSVTTLMLNQDYHLLEVEYMFSIFEISSVCLCIYESVTILGPSCSICRRYLQKVYYIGKFFNYFNDPQLYEGTWMIAAYYVITKMVEEYDIIGRDNVDLPVVWRASVFKFFLSVVCIFDSINWCICTLVH